MISAYTAKISAPAELTILSLTTPTHTGTDHTRESVPFLAYSPSMEGAGKLPDEENFALIGATITDNFGLKMPEGTIGASVLGKLI